MKICTKCKTEQDYSCFDTRSRNRGTFHSWCKTCSRIYRKEYRDKNIERHRKVSRDWHKNHITQSHENRRKWAKLNPEKLRNKSLRLKYGITLELYNKMLLDQNNLCAICKQTQKAVINKETNNKIRLLSVDHCHKTGIVRGLLCNHCNHGLGHFMDNPYLLEAAAQYLKRDSK